MVTSIEQRYIDLHPKSAEQYAAAKDIFPNGVTHDSRRQEPFPFYVTHADGAFKWDLDEHRIMDWSTHAAPSPCGIDARQPEHLRSVRLHREVRQGAGIGVARHVQGPAEDCPNFPYE